MPSPTLAELARILEPGGDEAAIGAAFKGAWSRARAAHPAIGVDEEAFARHLARHGDVRARMAGPHVADCYLALGCGLGDREAIRIFERGPMREVPAFVAHMALDARAIDDLLQALRDRLLAPRADGAKILHYGGQGPLGGWLRIATVRLALTLREKEARHHDRGDEALERASARPDPELLLARLHAGKAFKDAFAQALAALDAEQRTVLRMHYIDGLTIDEIGTAYAVHRATAARWVSTGRERVVALTREHLRKGLKLGARDLESVLRLVDSQLDLSLHRVLGGLAILDDE